MSLLSSESIVEFSDGLPGFEGCRRFVLMGGPTIQPFTIVQGVGPGAPAFAAIDPRRVVADFKAVLQPADLARLGADDTTPLVWLALVSTRDLDRPTANLRAPLVINPATLKGIQVIDQETPF